ncbi:hypothetical protein BKA63DRAFT_190877 [Paraphoma chrysanthemicola]|nr:hypothetical protein BKA63DRAFT_190877 [Paraphoma chrysanthemicola]
MERYEDLIESQAYSCPEDIYPHDSQDSDQAGTSDAGRRTGDNTAVPRHVDPHNLRARFSHVGRAYRKNYRKFAKKVVPKWKSQYVTRVPGAYRRLMNFLAGEDARRDRVSASRHPRGTAFHSTPQAPRGNARSPATQRPQKQPSPAPSGPVVTMDSMDFIDLTSTATESSQRSQSSSWVSSLVSLPDSMVDSRKCDTALPAPLPRPTKSHLDGNISDSEMDEAYQHAFADPGTPPSAQRPRTQSGWL